MIKDQTCSIQILPTNNLFRMILGAAFANIGSMIGTFLGVYVMMQVAGVDPRDVISAGLQRSGFNFEKWCLFRFLIKG